MVKVLGSRGSTVQVEMKGARQAIDFLRRKGKDVFDGADVGAFRGATFILSEVQESIIGNRLDVAPKSVESGRFANSITIDKIAKAHYKVFPRRIRYPGTNITTADVAKFLEFGTSKNPFPRPHFGNTAKKARNKRLVKLAVQEGIDKKLQKDVKAIKKVISKVLKSL